MGKPSLSQVTQVIAHKLIHSKGCIHLVDLLFELPFCSYNNLEHVCNIMIGWGLISRVTIMENSFPYITCTISTTSEDAVGKWGKEEKIPFPIEQVDRLTESQKRWLLQQLANGILMLTSREIRYRKPVLFISHSPVVVGWARKNTAFLCHVQKIGDKLRSKTDPDTYEETLFQLGKDAKFYRYVVINGPPQKRKLWHRNCHAIPIVSRKEVALQLWNLLSEIAPSIQATLTVVSK